MSSDEILVKVADLEVGDEFRMPFEVDGLYLGDYVTVMEFFPTLDRIFSFTPRLGDGRTMNVRGYVVARTIALPGWAYIPVLRLA